MRHTSDLARSRACTKGGQLFLGGFVGISEAAKRRKHRGGVSITPPPLRPPDGGLHEGLLAVCGYIRSRASLLARESVLHRGAHVVTGAVGGGARPPIPVFTPSKSSAVSTTRVLRAQVIFARERGQRFECSSRPDACSWRRKKSSSTSSRARVKLGHGARVSKYHGEWIMPFEALPPCFSRAALALVGLPCPSGASVLGCRGRDARA